MNIIYNYDYLAASIAILLVILYFSLANRLGTIGSRIFNVAVIIAIADILLDIFSSILIEKKNPGLNYLTEIILTVFFILQIVIITVFLYYVQRQRRAPVEELKKIMYIVAVPFFCEILLIAGNFLTGYVFYIDSMGTYIRGPLFAVMYAYMAFAFILTIIVICMKKKEYTVQEQRIFITIITIATASFVIQFLMPEILITGFSIAISIMILVLTINNPYRHTDSLTGLYNMELLRSTVKESSIINRPLNLLYVEIVKLKHINNILGNDSGNSVVREIVERILEITDISSLYRVESGKFVITSASVSEMLAGKEKLISAFSQPVRVKNKNICISVGICDIAGAESAGSADEILSYAEYIIREKMRKKIAADIIIEGSGTAETLTGFRKSQELARFLDTAIEKDLFEVHYQPIYSLKEKRFVMLEALSRLKHPESGYISPEIFIKIAENSGSIVKLSELQLRRICRFIKENGSRLKGIYNVKVNISPYQLMDRDAAGSIIDIIREYDTDPSLLQFEITETAATEYSYGLSRKISEFRNAGITLCLDDFGSGYANLNTVMKLPFSMIKLDKSMLYDIAVNPKVSVFYHNIVDMLSNLGFSLVAEGVETEEQLEMISSYGVDYIQGYYFSKPLTEDAVLDLLAEK